MQFHWNEEKYKSKATKKPVSIKEIMAQPDVFMQDGILVTLAVCEAITELMKIEEVRFKVQQRTGADEQWNPETQQAEPVERKNRGPIDPALSVEEQLQRLQNLVELKKVLKNKLNGKNELLKYSADTSDHVKGNIELRVRETLEQMLGEIDG